MDRSRDNRLGAKEKGQKEKECVISLGSQTVEGCLLSSIDSLWAVIELYRQRLHKRFLHQESEYQQSDLESLNKEYSKLVYKKTEFDNTRQKVIARVEALDKRLNKLTCGSQTLKKAEVMQESIDEEPEKVSDDEKEVLPVNSDNSLGVYLLNHCPRERKAITAKIPLASQAFLQNFRSWKHNRSSHLSTEAYSGTNLNQSSHPTLPVVKSSPSRPTTPLSSSADSSTFTDYITRHIPERVEEKGHQGRIEGWIVKKGMERLKEAARRAKSQSEEVVKSYEAERGKRVKRAVLKCLARAVRMRRYRASKLERTLRRVYLVTLFSGFERIHVSKWIKLTRADELECDTEEHVPHCQPFLSFHPSPEAYNSLFVPPSIHLSVPIYTEPISKNILSRPGVQNLKPVDTVIDIQQNLDGQYSPVLSSDEYPLIPSGNQSPQSSPRKYDVHRYLNEEDVVVDPMKEVYSDVTSEEDEQFAPASVPIRHFFGGASGRFGPIDFAIPEESSAVEDTSPRMRSNSTSKERSAAELSSQNLLYPVPPEHSEEDAQSTKAIRLLLTLRSALEECDRMTLSSAALGEQIDSILLKTNQLENITMETDEEMMAQHSLATVYWDTEVKELQEEVGSLRIRKRVLKDKLLDYKLKLIDQCSSGNDTATVRKAIHRHIMC